MALSIIYLKKIKTSESAAIYSWHEAPVTEVWNTGSPYPAEVKKVDSIIADGNELEFIKLCFKNLPSCHAFTVWEGEMANFIHQNLKHLTK